MTARPFAWRAVSTAAAPEDYDVAGRTATLLAYQPRHGVPPEEWSGDELTSASRYSNPAHPIAAATKGDESLQEFLTEFRPQWDGLLQLRLYLGAPQKPTYSLRYPSLDIKVTGKRWHVVDGASVSCASGSSVSLESIVLRPRAGSGAGTSAGVGVRRTAAATPTGGHDTTAATADTATTGGSGGHGPEILIAVVAAVVLAGGWAARRRALAASSSAIRTSRSESSKEGR